MLSGELHTVEAAPGLPGWGAVSSRPDVAVACEATGVPLGSGEGTPTVNSPVSRTPRDSGRSAIADLGMHRTLLIGARKEALDVREEPRELWNT